MIYGVKSFAFNDKGHFDRMHISAMGFQLCLWLCIWAVGDSKGRFMLSELTCKSCFIRNQSRMSTIEPQAPWPAIKYK
jgi:hypothetical protein